MNPTKDLFPNHEDFNEKMKKILLFLVLTLIISAVASPIIYEATLNQTTLNMDSSVSSNLSSGFFFGVTFGGTTVKQAENLIDKVKSYTNLFVVASWTISGAQNSSALDQVCDYAAAANLYFIVYFNFIFYNYTNQIGGYYNSSTWEDYGYTPWHVSWLNAAKERWGDKFLGVYLYDEPGGKQIDLGYWDGNTTNPFTGVPNKPHYNLTNYDQAASRFTVGSGSILRSGSMQHVINSSIPNSVTSPLPVFTSDYALYWFDYLAGYSTVFVELGGTAGVGNKVQQMALCRGAANVEGKDWGAIITWTYNYPPYMEDGQAMLKDMEMAYGAGAKYLLVFNYANSSGNPLGVLTDDQFNAMKTFWNLIQTTPRSSFGEMKGQVAYVLPENYGWGMRTPQDKIWGYWGPDNSSMLIWNNMMTLLNQYGPKLDIIYDDPNFNYQSDYSTIYYWNSTTIS